MQEIRRQRVATVFRNRPRGWVVLRTCPIQVLDFELGRLVFVKFLLRHSCQNVIGIDLVVQGLNLPRVQALRRRAFLPRGFPCLSVVGRQRIQLGLEEHLAVRLLDFLQALLQRLLLLVDRFVGSLVLGYLLGADQRVIDLLGREEHRLHAVVVLLRNRIELVVVTARALHGHG